MFQIKPGHLGKASIQAKPELIRQIMQTILQGEPSAAISAITGLDLGDNIGIMYHTRLREALITVIVEVAKTKLSFKA